MSAGFYLGEATPGTMAVSDLIAYADNLTPEMIKQQKECMIISMERMLKHGPQYTAKQYVIFARM